MKSAVIAVILFIVFFLTGCRGTQERAVARLSPMAEGIPTILPTLALTPAASPAGNGYEFPASPDPEKPYLFYLHGKIIEDQGIPAISSEFGEYEYEAILEKLSGYGFVVLSEQRPKNTDGLAYARKIKEQVTTLLDAGVPAANITIVGASKGAGITIEVSHLLENTGINYVIMGICHPDMVEGFIQDQIFLTGNVLSIYDSSDALAGSCTRLFSYSEDRGLMKDAEIVLEVGTGHGILYRPLDEWVLPTVGWARGEDP